MMKKEGDTSEKPDNTAFTQQRLPAWQPVLSAGIVIPGFLIIGLAFIGIGIALFLTSQTIQVLEMDYTGDKTDSPCFPCTGSNTQNCTCELTFSLDKLFTGTVFFYYGLTNYYQSFRRYGVSKDDYQLSGDTSYFTSPQDKCSPYNYDSNNNPIVPCGALANSMFNDTFELFQIVNNTKKPVPLDGKGIAWWTDYNIKYRNPLPVNGSFAKAFDGTVKPINWPKAAYELDTTDPNNNGFLNQDFLVWMRRAALPQFRKLYRRITEGDYAGGLPAGDYSLTIHYSVAQQKVEPTKKGFEYAFFTYVNRFIAVTVKEAVRRFEKFCLGKDYPVVSFNGQKKVVFSNVSWMGGKNDFLGIAYLVVGSLCVVMSAVMLIVYAKFKFTDDDA